jgi:MerR family copper efflux transcriptional regulator
MKVAELARHAGIAPSAVRFYEETGVLPVAARLENGYLTVASRLGGRAGPAVAPHS